MKVIILDTETTGTVEPIQAIEIALMELEGTPDVMISGPINVMRYKPTKPIELGAMQAHHIVPADLVDQPVWDEELEFGIEPNATLIAHNVDFDWGVIGKPEPVKRICTLALCRKFYPDVDSHKLGAMAYHLLGQTPATRDLVRHSHGAAADVQMLALMLPHIIDMVGVKTWNGLWLASEEARIPVTLTFGKNKGVKIKELDAHDPGYARWLLKQADVDPYLRTALENRNE